MKNAVLEQNQQLIDNITVKISKAIPVTGREGS
jgi:hypothetical protein